MLARPSRHLLVATAFVFVLLLAPAYVRAEEVASPKPRVEWSALWPRFRLWEYATTAVLDVGNVYFYFYTLPPAQPKWQGENAFDDTIRGWLVANTREGRVRAAKVSDILALGRYIVPFGIDLPVALLVHRQLGVTWQLLMMDMEAFAVAGFINNYLFYEAGRGRPDDAACAADPDYDPLCSIGNNASFPSGHTLGVATAAGLTCVHHRYLPLYGHPAHDASACVVMSLATVVTGLARVMSDRHYTSDVLVGTAIGFSSGYGLPWLLHYHARGADSQTEAGGRGVAVLPFAGPRVLGIGLVGAL